MKSTIIPFILTAMIIFAIIGDAVRGYNSIVDFVTIVSVESCVFYYIWLHFTLVKKYESVMAEKARTQMMISQIQPHFIYNSLSAISGMDDVPEDAQNAIIDFAKYLRENLDSLSGPELVTLDKELGHVKKYIALEKLRFGEKVNVEFDIKESDFFLPVLTLQMLVENAIKHGITKKYEGGTVKVSTGKEDKFYQIIVEDDGVGFDINQNIGKEHVGINNIRKRLEIFTGGTLEIVSEIGKGTKAIIRIPLNHTEVLS